MVAAPAWLLILLLVFSIGFLFVLLRRYLPSAEPLTEFQTVFELAKELGVNEETIYQWGITGKLIFAFIRHEPSDYEDVSYEKDKKGREIKVTRSKTTMFSFSSGENAPIDVAYLQPEDTARVVLNKTQNRSILVYKLFETNELLSKRAKVLLNCPVSVTKEELIVTKEELNRFRKKYASMLRQESRRAG